MREPRVNDSWDALSSLGAAWKVYGLKAGETIVLSTRIPGDPQSPERNYANFYRFLQSGQNRIVALADSYAPEKPDGAIEEATKQNNRASRIVDVGASSGATPALVPAIIDLRP